VNGKADVRLSSMESRQADYDFRVFFFLKRRASRRWQAQAGREECMQMECGDCEMYKPHGHLPGCTRRTFSRRTPALPSVVVVVAF